MKKLVLALALPLVLLAAAPVWLKRLRLPASRGPTGLRLRNLPG